MPSWAPASNRAKGGTNLSRIEAPVTLRGYLLCVFAAFGGILFGYDFGYISSVLVKDYFKQEFGGPSSDENAYNDCLYTTAQK